MGAILHILVHQVQVHSLQVLKGWCRSSTIPDTKNVQWECTSENGGNNNLSAINNFSHLSVICWNPTESAVITSLVWSIYCKRIFIDLRFSETPILWKILPWICELVGYLLARSSQLWREYFSQLMYREPAWRSANPGLRVY